MSIYTTRQKTASKDFLGDNCKLFMPFNEGSGTTFSDIVGDVVFTDSTAAVKKAYAASVADVSVASHTGTVPNIAAKHVIFGCVYTPQTSSSLTNFNMGSALDFILQIRNNQAQIDSKDQTANNITLTGTLGESMISVLTFDNSTGDFKVFAGYNGGAVSLIETQDASVHKDAPASSNKMKIGGNTANKQDFMESFVLTPTALPTDADLITFLDWTYQQVLAGNKVLHPDLANY